MTRIIIEGLRDRASLINAISVVLDTFNNDAAYAHEEHVFVPRQPPADPVSGREAETSDSPFDPDPAIGLRREPGPTPFVPCPRRGTHVRLTECWMCWSDVMRGAALEPEVLSKSAWQIL